MSFYGIVFCGIRYDRNKPSTLISSPFNDKYYRLVLLITPCTSCTPQKNPTYEASTRNGYGTNASDRGKGRKQESDTRT